MRVLTENFSETIHDQITQADPSEQFHYKQEEQQKEEEQMRKAAEEKQKGFLRLFSSSINESTSHSSHTKSRSCSNTKISSNNQ